jgi:hypothetical protein
MHVCLYVLNYTKEAEGARSKRGLCGKETVKQVYEARLDKVMTVGSFNISQSPFSALFPLYMLHLIQSRKATSSEFFISIQLLRYCQRFNASFFIDFAQQPALTRALAQIRVRAVSEAM